MKTAVTQTCARDRNFSLSLLVVGQTSKTKVTSSVSHLWSEIWSSSLWYNDLKHVLGYTCGIQSFVIVIYVLQQRNREAVMLKSRVMFRCHRNFLFCYLHCEMWIIPWSKGHVQNLIQWVDVVHHWQTRFYTLTDCIKFSSCSFCSSTGPLKRHSNISIIMP